MFGCQMQDLKERMGEIDRLGKSLSVLVFGGYSDVCRLVDVIIVNTRLFETYK